MPAPARRRTLPHFACAFHLPSSAVMRMFHEYQVYRPASFITAEAASPCLLWRGSPTFFVLRVQAHVGLDSPYSVSAPSFKNRRGNTLKRRRNASFYETISFVFIFPPARVKNEMNSWNILQIRFISRRGYLLPVRTFSRNNQAPNVPHAS